MGSGCSKACKNACSTNAIAVLDDKELKLIEWKATKPIYRYHWWPMRYARGSSLHNNIYSDHGGLDIYDKLMGTKSKEYQKTHYFRSTISDKSDSLWAGFCDKATILSCLYEYPKHSVIVKKHNSDLEFEFTPLSIEVLMMVACNNTIKTNMSIFLGERNYSKTKINKPEPLPGDLLDMMHILCSSKEAFAMDIDSGPAVWNYSYDSVTVNSYAEFPPRTHRPSGDYFPHTKPEDGTTEYLNFIINSKAYPEKNQNLWGYINTVLIPTADEIIEKKTQAWISKIHPDFIWKHYPTNSPWEGKCEINPEVDAGLVYQIYKKSMIESSLPLII